MFFQKYSIKQILKQTPLFSLPHSHRPPPIPSLYLQLVWASFTNLELYCDPSITMELHHTHRHLEIWTAPFSTLRSFAVMVLDLETSVLLLNFTSNFVVFLWFMVVKKFVFGFLMETWEFEFGFLKFSSFYKRRFFFFFYIMPNKKWTP